MAEPPGLSVRLSDLWRWDGVVDRGPYVLIGVVGFAIKHNLDRLVAGFRARQARGWSFASSSTLRPVLVRLVDRIVKQSGGTMGPQNIFIQG